MDRLALSFLFCHHSAVNRILPAIALCFLALAAARAQTVKGELTVNGVTSKLSHVRAYEVDSTTEKGFMDNIVIIADRVVPREVAIDDKKIEKMTTAEKLVALRVVLDPDCRVRSAAPFHPASKAFISSAAFIKWKPSAYNETTIAGRFYTDGVQELAGQKWKYDVTFSSPITLDLKAVTVPNTPK
jgi:hypothetical protein